MQKNKFLPPTLLFNQVINFKIVFIDTTIAIEKKILFSTID